MPVGTTLFPRNWKVTVGDLDVSTVDLEFKILRSIKSTPNKCTVTLWNLNPDHRAQLLQRNKPNPASTNVVGVPVTVAAGYRSDTPVLFSGDLREVASQRDVTDWKTVLSGDDGGRASRESRINISFQSGTSISTVLQQTAAALGLGLGNTSTFASNAQILAYGSTLPHSMTLSGNAADALKRLCGSLGITYSIQNGVLQFLPKDGALNQEAILLSPSTGLLGSPEASIDSTVSLSNPQVYAPGVPAKTTKPKKPKSTNVFKLRTLLIPGMVPGRLIQLDSALFQGTYVLTECEYAGQTWSNTWECQAIARIYNQAG